MRTMVRDSSHILCMDSVIRGHHIYKDIWTSSIGEEEIFMIYMQCRL